MTKTKVEELIVSLLDTFEVAEEVLDTSSFEEYCDDVNTTVIKLQKLKDRIK